MPRRCFHTFLKNIITQASQGGSFSPLNSQAGGLRMDNFVSDGAFQFVSHPLFCHMVQHSNRWCFRLFAEFEMVCSVLSQGDDDSKSTLLLISSDEMLGLSLKNSASFTKPHGPNTVNVLFSSSEGTLLPSLEGNGFPCLYSTIPHIF